MEGLIINYRRGRKTQTTNQMIVQFPQTDKKKADGLVGKEVVYVCPGKLKKEIKGKISSAHGNKGAVRVHFERGMPGQAVGDKVRFC